jgi:hypothetical protein
MVVYFYNPSYSGSRDRRIVFQDQPGKKLARPCLENKLGMVVHAYNPSYTGGRGRRIMVQDQPKKS